MPKELSLGMPVRCPDGQAGTVEEIIANPKTHAVSYLVVGREPSSGPAVVVPVSLVTEVTAEGVTLKTTCTALDSFPERGLGGGEPAGSRTARVRRKLPPWQPWSRSATATVRRRYDPPEQTVRLNRGMVVRDAAGTDLGEVTGLVADPTEQGASYLVLGGPEEPRLVPVDLINFIEGVHVYLRIEQEHVSGLPLFEQSPQA